MRIIANPRAGSKVGIITNPAGPATIQEIIEQCGVACDMVLTEGPGHATELARQAVKDGCEIVVAAGGEPRLRPAMGG